MPQIADKKSDLLNLLKDGQAKEIADFLLKLTDTMNDQEKCALLMNPDVLAGVCRRLATAPTWQEFDYIFESIVKAAPAVKQAKIVGSFLLVRKGTPGSFLYPEGQDTGSALSTMPPLLATVPDFSLPFRTIEATLASALMCACEVFETDPIKIRTILVKLKNNQFNLSGAESQLSDSFRGKAIADMVSAEQQKTLG